MTTYNTGNPVGSADARDLNDNAINLDIAVNTEELTWTDRTGRTRVSLSGIANAEGFAQQALAAALAAEASAQAAIEGQSNGAYGYTDKATMDADLSPPDNAVALVSNDPTPANNGWWVKDGASGTGSWIQSSYDRVAQVEEVAAVADDRAEAAKAALRATLSGALVSEVYNGANSYTDLPKAYTLQAEGDFFEIDLFDRMASEPTNARYSVLGTRGIGASNCVGFKGSYLYIRNSEGTWGDINTFIAIENNRRTFRVVVTAEGFEVFLDGVSIGTMAVHAGKTLIIDSVGQAYNQEHWRGNVYSLAISSATDGIFAAQLPTIAAGSTASGVTVATEGRGIIPEDYALRLDATEANSDAILAGLVPDVDYCHFAGGTSTIPLPQEITIDAAGDYLEIEVRAHRLNSYTDGLGVVGKIYQTNTIGFYDAHKVWLRGDNDADPYTQWDDLAENFTEWHTLRLEVVSAGTEWELFVDGVSKGARAKPSAFKVDNLGCAYSSMGNKLGAFIDVRRLEISAASGTLNWDPPAYLPNSSGVTVVEKEPVPESADVQPNEIVVKKTSATAFSIFCKGGAGEKWVEYPMTRATHPFDPTGTDPIGNLDSWNLREGYECTRDGVTFARGLKIITGGAWECAIREVGAADFIGSHAHGDEVLTDYMLLVDGVQTDIATAEDLVATRATFIQRSTLYRCNTETPVANFVKRYDFDQAGLALTSDIEWLEEVVIIDAYLTMLPINRDNSGVGPQITDTAIRDTNYTPEDVSAEGFTPVYDKATRVNIWGSASGIGAEVELLEYPDLPNREFNVSPATQYNKLYFDACGNYFTAPGEKWRQKARFSIWTQN